MIRFPLLAVLMLLGQQVAVDPTCRLAFNIQAAGVSSPFDNRGLGCTVWSFTYQASGFSALSVEIQAAADSNGSPATFSTFSGTGALTTTTYATTTGTGYAPWLQVKLNSKTGTGRISGLLQGWRH